MTLRDKLSPYFGIQNSLIELMQAATEFNFVVAATDETTAVSVGDGAITFRLPHDVEIQEVRASVNTAPVGSTIVIDITKNGTSILSTLLTIDATEKTSVTAAVRAIVNQAVARCSLDDEIAINVDQVGSGTAGAGLKVMLLGYR